MSEPAERSVEVNGEACRVWEKGSGPALIYLAGFGGLPRWTPFLDRLAERRRVIAPSLPGFPGASGHERLDTMLDWIAATLDLIEAVAPESVDLLGASVGGALAADVAAMSPALVRRLALIAPFGLYDRKVPPVDPWAQKPGALPGLLCAAPGTFAEFTAPPADMPAGEWSIIMARASEAAARLLWPLGDTRLARRLHRIRCPTLLVWGAEDKVIPPHYAELFARRIAGKTSRVTVSGAGHLADLDAPAQVAEAVLAAFA